MEKANVKVNSVQKLKPLSHYEMKNIMWPKAYKINCIHGNSDKNFDDFFKLNGSNQHKVKSVEIIRKKG